MQTHRWSGLLLLLVLLLMAAVCLWQNADTLLFYPAERTEAALAHYIVGADVRLDINLATAEELAELPAIGEVLAARIVEYRAQNGPFASTEEIKRVSGIGEGIYFTIADWIGVAGPGPTPAS